MKKEIIAAKLGENHGPYSHGILSGNYVFTTQVGTLPDGSVVSSDVYEQTKQLIENAKIVLEDVGSTLDNVVKVTIYILDLKENLAAMNKAYREFMPNHPFAARACVEVTDMVDEGVLVEMEFVAHID
ncbi:RidA family protein [Ruminococcaceae bacterium OttesenSCG-928-I18]|nr:RidA family protein [Ruminococcaceae bacterium OttesenSCG-928-I18]